MLIERHLHKKYLLLITVLSIIAIVFSATVVIQSNEL